MARVIRVLGAFQVCDADGRVLTGFQSDKARALLAYLAVEAARPHHRAQLAGLFWPEWPEQTALTYLRHALANIRKILGEADASEPPLLVTRQTIQFNHHSAYQLDVAYVTQALQTLTAPSPALAHLQQAVTAYHYAFLDGFYLNGCAAFEEWVVATRERLQRQVVDALQHLATHFERQGDYAQARHYAQRRVDLEPWLEDAHRQLMRLYARSGQRSAALAHYDHCRKQLAAELGIAPGAETQALYAAIRDGQLDRVTSDKVTSDKVMTNHPVTPSPCHPVTPSPKHNLPAPTTPLLGRTGELTALQQMLQRNEVRLVTLTGPGGVGKTQLALAAARQLLMSFVDGVFVTFLAPLREPTLVLAAIAQTLKIGEIGSRPLFERLVNFLRERSLLLVLDNVEHLLAAAPVIADLLAACPQIKVLATSRERLRLQGEHEYVTTPLSVPTAAALLTPTSLRQWPAVELFCQRAAAVRHDFALTQENATAVVAICARLDGLPLAIELAAARSKLLAPQALLTRLTKADGDRPLHFLKTDLLNAERRHRSLWETVAWSYTLLNPTEQHFFRRLAVFVSSYTVEAVVALYDNPTDATADTLDRLTALVDKNLLQIVQVEGEGEGSELRFTMLETIREFGLAQLAACQELAVLQGGHARYFAQWVNTLAPRLMSAASAETQSRLRVAYPNIRTAFQWLLAQREVIPCLCLCNDLSHFWTLTEQYKEAETYMQATLVLAAGSPPSPAYVNALAGAGFVAFALGQNELSARYFRQCLAMNDETGKLGNPKKIGMANGLLAWHCFDQGDYGGAHRYFAAAQANDLASGDEWALAMTLANRGSMAAELGDFAEAATLLQEALYRHCRIGQPWGIAGVLIRQAKLHLLQGNSVEAAHILAGKTDLRVKTRVSAYKDLLGMIALAQGDYDGAASLLKEALLYEGETSGVRRVLSVLQIMVQLHVKQTNFASALLLAGAIGAQHHQLNLVMPPVEKQFFEEAVAIAQRQLSEEAAAAAWAKGEAMTLDEAVAYALAAVG